MTARDRLGAQLAIFLTLLGFSILEPSLAAKPAGQAAESAAEVADYSAELPRIPPLSPAEALSSFQLVDGFQIEQVAAEPLVADPVAMAFDEDGRLYVVEMRGYSEQADEFLGQVRLLEDSDQDGRFDKSTLFADRLSWPTAVACYNGGVFVGVAPDIIYLRDEDGDGKADRRETVYTGFGKSNVQGLLNSFQWGLDNRIHGATSSSGGEVILATKPNQAKLMLKGRDFAFDPRSRKITAVSGGGQHGLSFNRWGDKFVCQNSDHCQLIVAAERYLKRNPFQASGSARKSIADDGPQAEVFRTSVVEPWRVVRTRLRATGVVPGVVEGGGRAAGYFTSATGITSYEGDALPEAQRGYLFVADVGSNLVHRKRLVPEGPIYRAERIDQGREFLTSSDVWFRPVQMANGPDGGLYIADMYREVIEHPKSLPASIKRHLDLTSGRERGRIYRIVPEGFEQPAAPRLSQASIAELVAKLETRNAWQRRTAARLLYERQDVSAAPLLSKLSRNANLPEARIAALHALSGLEQLQTADLLAALGDDHPEVQRQAILLSEGKANESHELRQALYRLADSKNPRVQRQLAFSLGELTDSHRFAVLAKIATKNRSKPLVLQAVATSLHSGAGQVLEKPAKKEAMFTDEAGRTFLADLVRQIAKQQASGDLQILSKLMHQAAETDPIKLIFICNRLGVSRKSELLSQLLKVKQGVSQSNLDSALELAEEVAVDPSQSIWKRVEAIGILRWLAWEKIEPLAEALLTPSEPEPVQSAVVECISHVEAKTAAQFLVDHWRGFTAPLREQASTVIYARTAWASLLLDAIQNGELTLNDLGASRLSLLASHPDKSIRDRAAKFRRGLQQHTGEKLVNEYLPALNATGDASKGEQVFRKLCASCHQHKGIGYALGPNLSTAQTRGPETLLLNILAPNKEVNPQYLSYVVLTVDGKSFAGMIKSQTATAVTLQRSSEESVSILRSDIESMSSTGLSLMPEGLNRELSVSAMADLLAFLSPSE